MLGWVLGAWLTAQTPPVALPDGLWLRVQQSIGYDQRTIGLPPDVLSECPMPARWLGADVLRVPAELQRVARTAMLWGQDLGGLVAVCMRLRAGSPVPPRSQPMLPMPANRTPEWLLMQSFGLTTVPPVFRKLPAGHKELVARLAAAVRWAQDGAPAPQVLKEVDLAIATFRRSGSGSSSPSFEPIRIDSTRGALLVLDGRESQAKTTGCALVVDFGGNDRYTGSIASSSASEPVRIQVDLGGDDKYHGEAIAAARGGLSLIMDLAGNDEYRSRTGQIGSAEEGLSAVDDRSGNDVVLANRDRCVASARGGIAIWLDRAGNDRYATYGRSIGYGESGGLGFVIELAGNDQYLAQRAGDHAVGCGVGGQGYVVDAEGSDLYSGMSNSIGIGEAGGFGGVFDAQGADRYRAPDRAIGYGQDLGLGCVIDRQGDDSYNFGRPIYDVISHLMGVGQAGGCGVFWDLGGQDAYRVRNRSAGYADDRGVGLFWDRLGADRYAAMPGAPYHDDSPFGGAVPPSGPEPWIQKSLTLGIFLDTDGEDQYPQGIAARELAHWRRRTGPFVFSFGLDRLSLPTDR